MKLITFVAKESEVENLGLMYLATIAQTYGYEPILLKDKGQLTVDEILDQRPSIVGFQIFTGYHKRMFQLADQVRKSGTFVMIGGPHATYFFDDCQEHADQVYKGEAINTFLTPSPFNKKLTNPDEFPFPYRGWASGDIQNIMTSFGCVHKCSYCYNSSWQEMYNSSLVRQRSVDSVMVEANQCDEKLIFFQDDYFGWNIKWLREFAEKWNGRPYHCQLRIDSINEERLRLFEKSGCTGITFAIESGSERIRKDLLKRPISDKLLMDKIKLVKSSRLNIRTEQMLGIPTSTLSDELDLLEINIELKPEIAWSSIYQPYLGTQLGDWCVENGWYQGNNDDIDDSFFKTTRLNFPIERKVEIERLQEVFNLCSKLPYGEQVAESYVKSGDFKTLLAKTREVSYDSLYRN